MTHQLDIPTILIVDDTPSNLSVVVDLFESRGYRVAIAQDGEEGLQRAQLVLPSLILLDVMLPDTDGFEICRRLKAQEKTRNIPVIFMTSLASVEHKVNGFDAGGVDYVTKPLQIDEVMARVDTHLKLHAAQKRLEEQNAQLEQRVTERTAELGEANRRLREEIEERERAYRRMELLDFALDHVTEDVSLIDQNGMFRYVNEHACRLQGYPRETLLGMGVFDIDSDWTAERYAAFWLELRERGAITLETRHRASDGRIFPVEVEANYFEYEGTGYNLTLVRDISGRKQHEAKEKIRLQIFEQLAQGTGLPEVLDLVGQYVEQINPNLLTSIMLVDEPGQHLLSTSAPNLPQAYIATVHDIAIGEGGGSCGTAAWRGETIIAEDFRTHPFWASYTELAAQHGLLSCWSEPIFGSTGKVLGTFGIYRREAGAPTEAEMLQIRRASHLASIAIERTRTAEALVTREREFRTLAENLPDNLARYDKQCRIVYMNPRQAKVLGKDLGEMIGKMPLESSPGPLYADYQAGLTETIATGLPREMELTLPDQGGGVRYHHIRFVAERDAKGEIVGALAIGRDITERKRAERELLLLNLAVNASSEAVFLMNAQGRFVYVNEEAYRSLGYSREELLTMTPSDIDPDITGEVLAGLLDSIFAHGPTPRPMESRHRTRDGRIFPVEIAASPLKLEGKNYCLTMVRDISERKEAEQRLHEKSQAIRAVVENSPDTIIRYDSQCRRLYLNPAMEKIFGQPRERLHGTSPSEYSILPAHYLATIKKVLETGREQRMESSFRDAEGETRWVDLRLAPEFGSDGKVVSVLAIGRDITERKLAENALKENEQRYHEIFDNAVEGMYLLEVTEDGRFRNLDINPALARSTGVPCEAMVGKFVEDVVPGEAGRLSVEKYRRCVAAGTTITESIELDLPAGRRCYYSTITPIYYDGRIHRLIGISRDITELKRAERELEESRAQLRGLTARREEVREEERKYIAREVHDELGQILTGLQLNVSVLLHKFAADASPLRDQLQETMTLTDRALGVARNVASALRPAALDMGVVSALEWLTARFSLNTGIKCEVHAEELEIPLDESSAIALFRIVQESLTNIARHAQASRADIILIRDEDEYSLKVRDNGAGFEQKMKKADSFGLVGMRERALLLGGEVIINSKPGEGTEVEVRIPAHQTEGLL